MLRHGLPVVSSRSHSFPTCLCSCGLRNFLCSQLLPAVRLLAVWFVLQLEWKDPDEEGTIQFMVNEKNFNLERVRECCGVPYPAPVETFCLGSVVVFRSVVCRLWLLFWLFVLLLLDQKRREENRKSAGRWHAAAVGELFR